MVFTFDWHKRDEDFLKWMLLALVSPTQGEIFEELSEATKGWTKVEMEILINGKQMPVEHFVDRLKTNMQYQAEKAAKEKIRDMLDLRKLQEAIEEFQHSAENKIYELAAEAGIEMSRYDD
jgi:hypothetical protein